MAKSAVARDHALRELAKEADPYVALLEVGALFWRPPRDSAHPLLL